MLLLTLCFLRHELTAWKCSGGAVLKCLCCLVGSNPQLKLGRKGGKTTKRKEMHGRHTLPTEKNKKNKNKKKLVHKYTDLAHLLWRAAWGHRFSAFFFFLTTRWRTVGVYPILIGQEITPPLSLIYHFPCHADKSWLVERKSHRAERGGGGDDGGKGYLCTFYLVWLSISLLSGEKPHIIVYIFF